MDIDLLSKMVKELILDDDRVVLPGLGCFVAEIVPACFSDKGYTINPPYRKLYFRARPDEGDSLVDFYAKSNSVDHEVAEKIVRDFVSELKSVLHVRKTVVFPGLGRLRATKENNIFFVADEDLDIYPEGFGLEPISLKTHTESRTELSATVASLKTMISDTASFEPTSEQAPRETDVRNPVIQDDMSQEREASAEIPTPVETQVLESAGQEQDAGQEVAPVEPVAEPTPIPAAEPAEVPVAEPAPFPVAEPAEAPETEQEADENPSEPEPAAVQIKETGPENRQPARVKWLLWVILGLILLVVAYMAVGRLCPELIDRFLYTPEELEILRSF